jgi:hypothetical protein
LIGIQPNTGTEGRLEKVTVRGGGRSPTKRLEVGGEDGRIVRSVACNRLPTLVLQDRCINLGSPDDLSGFALRVIIDACQAQGGQFLAEFAFALDQPSSAAKTYKGAGAGGLGNWSSPGTNVSTHGCIIPPDRPRMSTSIRR